MSSPSTLKKFHNSNSHHHLPGKRNVHISYVPFSKIELEDSKEQPGYPAGLSF